MVRIGLFFIELSLSFFFRFLEKLTARYFEIEFNFGSLSQHLFVFCLSFPFCLTTVCYIQIQVFKVLSHQPTRPTAPPPRTELVKFRGSWRSESAAASPSFEVYFRPLRPPKPPLITTLKVSLEGNEQALNPC